MRLKLTLHRENGPVDLAVTADATATVGDIAARLVTADPASRAVPAGPVALRVHDPVAPQGSRQLPPETSVMDAGLLSGMHVQAVPSVAGRGGAGSEGAADPSAAAVARVRVIAGPDVGREFTLPAGSAVVGRDPSCGIRLSDPLVSKKHARVTVSDSVELVDLGSANGLLVAGVPVPRTVLAPKDAVTLGDTTLALTWLKPPVDAAGPQVDHIRSPRAVERHPGTEFPPPALPQRPQPQRLPYLAMLAPLLMGAVMWAFTQQVLGVIMMGLSPVMLIGGYLDQRMQARRALREERQAFAAGMASLRVELEQARLDEVRVRHEELPSCARLRDDAMRLGPLLWSERPETPTFLTVSAGLGRDRSRNTIDSPPDNRALPESLSQLAQLRDEFAYVDGVPIAIPLREAGSLGVTGVACAGAARSLIVQLVTRHAPAELVLAALTPAERRGEWGWLSWLPHTSSSHSPLPVSVLADNRAAATRLLAALEELVEGRAEGGPRLRGPVDPAKPDDDGVAGAGWSPTVVVLVEHGAPADRARLTRLLERGPDVGIHVVWCAPEPEQLPAACRSRIDVDVTGLSGKVVQVRRGETGAPVRLDTMDAAGAEQLARHLAPVVDVGVPEADDSDLPRSVSLPAILGKEVLDETDAVLERWRQNDSIIDRSGDAPVARRREGNLRAVFGHAGSEPFAIDLRADGPHALVGGTTGAGKSEFLQAWVLAMAAAHSPDRLTFLFVDYKGGAAFADCTRLPHCVGLVTDLSPAMVRRALLSLKAELTHREHILSRTGAKDQITLEKQGHPECPPSLVIIVDEFAALKAEVPEFVDGVVDVAQRGRSLGLHLVLATQRPAGAINDNLRANTNLRIALRMADAEDSTDILGEPTAAFFDPSVPGRGAAKRGPGRITTFQSGYAGGRTTNTPPRPRIDIEELGFGADAVWDAPEPETAAPDEGALDIARIVDTVRSASQAAGIPDPRRPWLDELAPLQQLEQIENPRTDARLPLGLLDDPQQQAQSTVFYEPDRDGNLALFGTGGSGKSTALRSLAAAAAATTVNGGPTHVYGLDFGARGLSMLEGLPHVGAIVPGDDEERVVRMLRMLRDTVDDRAVRYAAVNAGSIGEYRTLAHAPREPRILLLVDGIGAFKEEYEFGPANLSQWFTAFAQIAADGRGVGVHVVVTGDRPNALPNSIASTVQRRIVLRMANEDEYLSLGVPRDVLGAASPPGRGILDGKEVQLALLGESSNVAVQARRIERLAKSLASAYSRGDLPRPAPVLRLAEHVALAELQRGTPSFPVIGVDDVTLGAASFEARGAFLVGGSPGGGRSTALATIAAALVRADPTTRIVWLAPRRTPGSGRAWAERADSADAVSELCGRLTASIEAGDGSGSGGRYALFIEHAPEFTGTSAEYPLDELIRAAIRADLLVVGEGESSTWQQAYTLGVPFKAAKRGLVLAPGEMDGDMLYGTPLGRIRRADFPPGRGFLIGAGRASKVQVAHA